MKLLYEYIKTLLERRGKKKKSYMIALYPDKKSLKKIKDIQKDFKDSGKEMISEKDIHATIRYFKIKDGGDYEKMIEEFNQLDFSPIEAKIKKVALLGDSVSLMLNSKEMNQLFGQIDKLVKAAGGPPSDFPSFLPHTALCYEEPELEKEVNMKDKDIVLVYDQIKFIDNLDKVYATKKGSKND